MKKYIVKDLTNAIFEFNSLVEAKERYTNFYNSTEIVEKNEDGKERVLESRTHKEVGMIEINNKCVYLKVPFYELSDKPEIKISKIGETPDKLRSKMDVIDERWN
jgi:hypothetical protein